MNYFFKNITIKWLQYKRLEVSPALSQQLSFCVCGGVKYKSNLRNTWHELLLLIATLKQAIIGMYDSFAPSYCLQNRKKYRNRNRKILVQMLSYYKSNLFWTTVFLKVRSWNQGIMHFHGAGIKINEKEIPGEITLEIPSWRLWRIVVDIVYLNCWFQMGQHFLLFRASFFVFSIQCTVPGPL